MKDNKPKIYMGISVCTVYGEPEIEEVYSNIDNNVRGWTRLSSKRVYSDEIQMANGIFAYNKAVEMFEKNNLQAFNAWRRLI